MAGPPQHFALPIRSRDPDTKRLNRLKLLSQIEHTHCFYLHLFSSFSNAWLWGGSRSKLKSGQLKIFKVPFAGFPGRKSGPLVHTNFDLAGQTHTNLFPGSGKSDRERVRPIFNPK
jgi:hypothetical protein